MGTVKCIGHARPSVEVEVRKYMIPNSGCVYDYDQTRTTHHACMSSEKSFRLVLSSPGERPQSSAIDEVEVVKEILTSTYILMQNSRRNVCFIFALSK